jgi:predicted house-cleaning noncanonical NTP pyrophosphatase (MazG superfamily)
MASKSELDVLLRKKVVEEANELLQSGETEEIIDILEVVDALVVLRGIDRVELEHRQEQKRTQRGGFSKGYVLQE